MNLFDIDNLEIQLKNLEAKTLENDFWNNQQESEKVLDKIKNIKFKYTPFKKLKEDYNELLELDELITIEKDEELENELLIKTKKLEKGIEKLELQTLLSGKYDKNNAIITIHPGAGGTESQDWAEMLYRMY